MTLIDGSYHIQLQGITHWYRIASASLQTCPLLILHGGPGGNVYNFERTIGPLLETFTTIIYFEQRGCGRSNAPADLHAYSIPLLIHDIELLRQALTLDTLTILGFSFGGELALEYTLAYPTAVHKLILQAPGISMPGRTTWVQLYGFERITTGSLQAHIRIILQDSRAPEDQLQAIWSVVDSPTVDRFLFHQPAVAAMNRALWRESGLGNTGHMAAALARHPRPIPLYQQLSEIRVPTLVCVGLYDRNSGVDVNRDIAQAMPYGAFSLFEDSAHFPDMEESAKYAQTVATFLAADHSL